MANGILGLGSYLPQAIRSNNDWTRLHGEELRAPPAGGFLVGSGATPVSFPARCQQAARAQYAADEFQGAVERRVADAEMPASTMEIAAARSAIANAGVHAADIDLIISNSCPADEFLPANATLIQHGLQVGAAMTIGVDTACTSFLSGINVADALLEAGRARVALVVVSSQMTRLVDYGDRSSMIHGDAAAAAIIGPVAPGFGFLAHQQRGEGEFYGAICCGPKGASRWYEGDAPLCGHSRQVELARARLDALASTSVEATQACLEAANLTVPEVSAFFPHQGAAWTNLACSTACGLEHTRTVDTFAEIGNVGAPSHGVNLQRAADAGLLSAGDVVLLFGVGMGLNWASTAIRWGGQHG